MTAQATGANGEASPPPATLAGGGTAVPVWPAAQQTATVAGAQIVATHFADSAIYHPLLIDAALAAAQDPRFHDPRHHVVPYGCGANARNIEHWGVPAAELVHRRALLLAHLSLGKSAVFADDTWASIYRDGDYCLPHSHTRAEVSIVYMLDPDDTDPADPLGGRICFVDPRIAWCCPIEPGRVTRPLLPAMPAGSMLLFAGAYLHSVTPYRGVRPRITLSWNITREQLAGGPRDFAG